MTVILHYTYFLSLHLGLTDEQVIWDLIRAELERAVDWMEPHLLLPSLDFQWLTHRIN